MTSPNYSASGYADSSALAGMYEQQGKFNQQELDQRYKISKDDVAARLKIASQQSKDSRYGIDQQRDSEREKLALAREDMEKIGIPKMLIDKYIAEKNYEIAASELVLKRDMFVEETAQAKAKLQLDREQMERVGIPQMEINKYVAEQNARIQQAQQTGYFNGAATLDRQKFQSDADYQRAQLAQSSREFQTTASGYMQQAPSLTPTQRTRYEQIKAFDAEQQAGGQPGASLQDRVELSQYEDILAGRPAQGVAAQYGQEDVARGLAPAGGGGGTGQNTLDRDKFQQDQLEQARRYNLDVSKFGADLASTPDTYFQARRFQGVDVPRLMGGAGAATSQPQGGPTPGVATMGAYLSGQDPYGQPMPQYQAPDAGGAGGYMVMGPDGSFQQGGGGAGGSYESLKTAGGGGYGDPNGLTGAVLRSAAPTASVYGGPAVSATVGAQGYAQPQQQAAPSSAYPSQDPRQKQAAALAKALPPSPYDGLNEQDAAALHGMEAIYKRGGQGAAGGEMERLKASGRYGFMSSAGKLLGYDPKEFESQYQAYRPAQGSARAAY